MKSIAHRTGSFAHRLCFVVLALAFGSATVQAGDWLDQSYVTVDIGPSVSHDISLRSGSGTIIAVRPVGYGTGIRGDVILGHNLSESWAIEMETGVVWNPNDSGVVNDMYQIPFLLNALYRIPVSDTWTPYLRAGVGGTVTTLSALVLPAVPFAEFQPIKLDDVAFACQAGAGLKYRISTRVEVDLEYKFLGTFWHSWDESVAMGDATIKSDHILTHSLLASFTWRF